MANKKILAVFGNVAFYGQERANLQVFELLKNSGFDLLLAVNTFGFHWHLQSEVEARDLRISDFSVLSDEYKYTKALQVMLYSYLYSKENKFNFTNAMEAGIISFKNLNSCSSSLILNPILQCSKIFPNILNS